MITGKVSRKGFSTYKMDPKYRVSIPVAWRTEKGEDFHLQFSNKRGWPIVKVLTEAAYQTKISNVENGEGSIEEKNYHVGKLAMLCREATLNEQGKLLIPKDLSDLCGIEPEAEVILAGRETYFEIWSKANHADMMEKEREAPLFPDRYDIY